MILEVVVIKIKCVFMKYNEFVPLNFFNVFIVKSNY